MKLKDPSPDEILEILSLTDQLKHGITHRALSGRMLGMYQLGGTALFLSANGL